MSNDKNFVGMVELINNISEGNVSNKSSLNEYINMLESVEIIENSIEESDGSDELESKREEYMKDLKDKEDYFKKRYGDDWESVMYGTATNLAKKDLGID